MTSSSRLPTRRADHSGAPLARQTSRTLKSGLGRINDDPRHVQLRNSVAAGAPGIRPETAKMRWFQATLR